jgi:Acetylornithine deacetylase/Succinyl-diaminopimelate desuccinylase and related deacylases
MKNKIDNYIRTCQADMISDIQTLIRIPSINGDTKICEEALDWILAKAARMGMITRKASTGDVGIIQIGSGEMTMGILSHVDVVGIGDSEKWTFPPFEGKVAKGFIWGRGIVDDKGPAIMCLYALKAIRELNIPLNQRIWLIIGTCEESEWTDIENLKREFGCPDYGFSPDGDFPIFNREKGYCDVLLTFREPCIDQLAELSSGDSVNTIPSKAVIAIKGHDREVFDGIGCHSSVPAIGINAISKMAVEKSSLTQFNFIRFLCDYLAKDYNGTALGIDSEEAMKAPPAERTTIVPTILSMSDGTVKMNLNMRLWFDVNKASIEKCFDEAGKKYGFTYEIHDFLKAMTVNENEEFLRVMADVYSEYGFEPEFRLAVGSSYAKSMPHFVSWGPIFETDLSCAHMEDERLSIDSMMVATKMYATYIARIASPLGEIRNQGEQLSSLDKALKIFSLFCEPPFEYDVPTICTLSGMNRTTVYRNLQSLVKAGLLKRDEVTKVYSLGRLTDKIAAAAILKKK